MLEKTARSAASRTDSDSAVLASSTMPPAAQVTCLAIRPMARSRARRRDDSTDMRILGSLAHRKAVRLGTLFLAAHAVTDIPCAIATASLVFGLWETFSWSDTGWHTMAVFHRVSVWPRSRFSARGPGWPECPLEGHRKNVGCGFGAKEV